MKIDDLMMELAGFRHHHGNVEVEFQVTDRMNVIGEIEEFECEFNKVHEGYVMAGPESVVICEIRLKGDI
jgi:hypothetical protein